ncbi:MAG TPA: hypothetical protein VGO30_18620 [Mycobacterium sp.]|nr:hypothetical protein [Mycobacterium sp.]
MPDDLLRHVIGPTPYSSWWLWIAMLLLLVLIGWYAGVFVWTLPNRRLRDLPVLGGMRDKMVRHRFARTVHEIGDRYRSGELAAAPAGAAVSRALRGFLQETTGVRAEYMQLDDIAGGELASAAPLLAQLNDAQFNAMSEVDVGAVSDSAEELIRSWT